MWLCCLNLGLLVDVFFGCFEYIYIYVHIYIYIVTYYYYYYYYYYYFFYYNYYYYSKVIVKLCLYFLFKECFKQKNVFHYPNNDKGQRDSRYTRWMLFRDRKDTIYHTFNLGFRQ